VSGDPQQLLRDSFDQVAELYERARPKYPPELFDDLTSLAQLPDQARLVEIGCGTGQATLPLAERGYWITCIELGAQLATVARRKLARFPNVEVITANFESWQPSRTDFDAAIAFTAFHWIPLNLRYAKTASLLRDHGTLAVAATRHVLPPDGDQFFLEVQADYEAVLPDDPATKAGGPKHPDSIPDLSEEITASGLFSNLAARRYLWEVTYTANEYLAVLNTYSGHRALDHDTREELLGRIQHRIHARPGEQVRKTYLATLNIATKTAGAPPVILDLDDDYALDAPRRREDTQAWRRLDLDPQTARFLGWNVEVARSQPDAHYDQVAQQFGREWDDGSRYAFTIRRRSTGEPVGSVELRPHGDQAAASYMVAPEIRGQGIAPKALELVLTWAVRGLALRRVTLACHVENTASRRVAEKCGFELLGREGDELQYQRQLPTSP
jgi:RimJ/RimL family protein N-acetyltransferase/SAM-dependent methyltransferase